MNQASQQPNILIVGSHQVSVAPVNTIEELVKTTEKFANIVQATPVCAVCQLATSVGDLSASVTGDSPDNELFAKEVAGVLIAAMVVAASRKITAEQIGVALADCLSENIHDSLAETMTGILSGRGMTSVQ